jgi:hypothetical protein
VTSGLFGTFERVGEVRQTRGWEGTIVREVVLLEPPLWVSWAVLFVICAVCLALLSWRVKAYEVVK